MKVIIKKPRQEAEVDDIEHTLHNLQAVVDGYIEVIYPFADDVGLICNEEGKLINLQPNFFLADTFGDIYDCVVGTVILVGLTDDDFRDLTDDEVEKYLPILNQNVIET